MDQGFIVTSDFLIKIFKSEINKAFKTSEFKDSKSILQELVQQIGYLTPKYELIEVVDKGNDKTFIVEVKIGYESKNFKSYGIGKGTKISIAEFDAASEALSFFNKR